MQRSLPMEDGINPGRKKQSQSFPWLREIDRILVVGMKYGPRGTQEAIKRVSAFAEENNLATIVGTKTPGRLLSGSAYKVSHGYILGLPVAAYLTWQGRMLENNGIVPKFSIELSREALKQGRDTQLGTAIDVAKAL
jgi:Peptidase family S41